MCTGSINNGTIVRIAKMAALESAETTPSSPPRGEFSHPAYELIDGDKIKRRSVPAPASRADHIAEEESVLAELHRHVRGGLLGMGLKEMFVPDEDAPARCPFYITDSWEKKKKLMVVLTNQVRFYIP
jgi:hypothetical protein